MSIPFIQAKHYRKGRGGHKIDLFVMHTVQGPERTGTAEGIAEYFRTTTRPASSHYVSDVDSTIQCVKDSDQAAAAPGANQNGLHFELAGYAEQSAADWSDAYSEAMLRNVAALCAEKAKRYGVPLVWLSPADLKAGKRGFTSHNNVSEAWGRSTHWDPGPWFPHARFLGWVREAMGEKTMPDDLKTVSVTLNDKPTEIRAYLIDGVSYASLADVSKALGWPGPTWHPPRRVNLRTKE